MFDPRQMEEWEERFEAVLSDDFESDPAHRLDHVRRVVESAKRIGKAEGAQLEIVVPAAWLHDCVTVDKDSPDRAKASSLAAKKARQHLTRLGYPKSLLTKIAHCIRAHSFSAGVRPESQEAKVVQDADRLDALGAVGLARCFVVGGRLGLPIYDPTDPFCEEREPDDSRSTVDHFFVKLLKLPGTMQTGAGRLEAERRVMFLKQFLEQLESELPARR
jgi:uncharacterized protein